MKLNEFNSLTPFGGDGMYAFVLVSRRSLGPAAPHNAKDFSAVDGISGMHRFVADAPQAAPIAWAFPPDHLQLMVSSTKSALLVIESCGRAFSRSQRPSP
jgi:hypothetical protein